MRYKECSETLKWIKELIAKGLISQEEAEKHFPMLSMSEDEIIKNEIIEFFNAICNPLDKEPTEGISVEDIEEWIAWLEKQGEQKEIDYNEEFKKCRANPLYFFDKYVKVKFKEQKPAEWSEEDEKRLNSCLNILRPKTILGNVETINTKWLKSLKQRHTWKPSEELIKALEKTLIYFQRLNAFGETIDNLKELHQQLNKL